MPFSKSCQYAILAMSYLAERDSSELISVREISEQADVPLPFLAKIISTLSRHGLVSARRGPRGGVALSRPADQMTVAEVVSAIDGTEDTGSCVLGFAECDHEVPCPVHENWLRVREEMKRALHGRTLTDLAGLRATAAKKRAKHAAGA